ncbi:MAG: YdeI/OmpD-associated family protein [Rhodoglobus sp.]
MTAVADKPIMHFATADEWEAWLASHKGTDGVRLQLRKQSSKAAGITYQEALQVALCHGWIDGQAGSLDEDFSLRVFTPRRARSPWSKVNVDHVTALVAAGRMRPAGQAEIDRAKADGRWDAAYRQKDAEIPADLQAALDANPAAAQFFPRLNSQNRFAILFRIGNVKRAETRAAKIVTYVAMLERGETIYPQKTKE